ncbi:MFS transporter [Paenibacillus humicola]|uniref:MFS transporter n=1 Tax=Paenibacillus humicola TaxID=3110540 RepID=UPI00237B5D5F|nr:MFS transporter [Paenibacillus humicola]
MNIRAAGGRLVDRHFHALTHRNYRYFWYGQCISLIGTWMQNIGQSWLVLTLTGSPFLLGLVGAVQFLPITFLSLFAGVIIDRYPKRRILLITQSVSMCLALTLAVLVFTDTVRYGYVLTVAFLLGLTNTFDLPTRQSFNIEIVGKEDLMNAIALNSTTFNLARILGPSIGALMMAYLGTGWCFLLNGLSFVAVLLGLLRIEAKPYVRAKKTGIGLIAEIKDGIRYMAGDPLLSQTILLVTVIGTIAFNFNVLIPVFTRTVLHLDEKTYGGLMSCLGAGSLIGAVTVGLRSKIGPKLKVSVVCSIVISIGLFLIGLSGSVMVTGLLLLATGICTIAFSTNSNSLLQMNARDEYRARVMSVYSLVFAGSTPLGNLLTGYAADRFGADSAYMLCGLSCLVPCLAIILVYRNKRKAAAKFAGAGGPAVQQAAERLAEPK